MDEVASALAVSLVTVLAPFVAAVFAIRVYRDVTR